MAKWAWPIRPYHNTKGVAASGVFEKLYLRLLIVTRITITPKVMIQHLCKRTASIPGAAWIKWLTHGKLG